MSAQYIFTMRGLSKVYAPGRTVLEAITLAFYPGAKIGVLGYNGAGKSTLLRIMAGGAQEDRGEAPLGEGAGGGKLEQEPKPDPAQDRQGHGEGGGGRAEAPAGRLN